MNKGVVCVALLVLASIPGWAQSESKPETLVRWQFAGTKGLAGIKQLKPLREILELNESKELRNVALNGFAGQMASRFAKANTNAQAAVSGLITPLLPDLIENETRFEMTTGGAQEADWILAIKLPADRIAEWSKNLSDLAVHAQMRTAQNGKGAGWSAQRDEYRMSFTTAKNWVVLEGGMAPAKAGAKALNTFRGSLGKRMGKQVLHAELDFPRLAKVWSAPRLEHVPKLILTVLPRGDGLRSEMQIDYPQPLNITLERWNPPTELIRDPLIGFTALQGIGERLGQSQMVRSLGARKMPNQVYLWAQNSTPFSVFAAADIGNPAEVIHNFVEQVLPTFKNLPGGKINVLTNRPALIWRGLPVVAPYVEAADEGRSPFLLAGLFPVAIGKTNPAPAELFQQLKKKNLVYYEWEITEERLKQWRPIWQFTQILRGNMFPMSASDKWIEAITPRLANTITEVTLENPRRLKLVRQSQSGLNALELVLLAHAVDPNDVTQRRTGPVQGTKPRTPAQPAPALPLP
ncbi:MAG TPA: hypothetical protein VK633_12885 [Verrucomicrobiae bacterium]|nr:hypothetical protein [Verrucomicrobiae bacterium]